MAEIVRCYKGFELEVVTKGEPLTGEELHTIVDCFRLSYELELGWYQKGRPDLDFVKETIEENDKVLANRISSLKYVA